jgi:predicted DNA-binding ribbon-helix-helix protein
MFTKHSVSTGERMTDVSMEEEFWTALRDIAADRDTTLSALVKEVVATIDCNSDRRRTASVLCTYVLEQYLPINQRPNPRDIYRSTFEDPVLKC